MSFKFINRVPFHSSHNHFFDYIESFPALHQHDDHDHHEYHAPLSQKEQLLDHLRNDLVESAKNPIQV